MSPPARPAAAPGETIATPCNTCRGAGLERRTVKQVVPIPAGVDDGTQIRLAGEGEPGAQRRARTGDLYVVIHVKPHRFFRRRDDDILLDLAINVAQAALGAKVTVPTVDGEEAPDHPRRDADREGPDAEGQGRPPPAAQRPRRPAGGRLGRECPAT